MEIKEIRVSKAEIERLRRLRYKSKFTELEVKTGDGQYRLRLAPHEVIYAHIQMIAINDSVGALEPA